MSIPVVYTDSDKSKYYSTDDYVTESDYNHSFFNSKQTSQLRLAIAPGTVKYFNKSLVYRPLPLGVSPGAYISQEKLIPIITQNSDDEFGYMSYSKK